MQVTWNLYNGQTPRLTQFAQPSAVSALGQNGAAAAQLVRVGLGDRWLALFLRSTLAGEQLVVGRLAMASIRNPESAHSQSAAIPTTLRCPQCGSSGGNGLVRAEGDRSLEVLSRTPRSTWQTADSQNSSYCNVVIEANTRVVTTVADD
jgi:hypothetical protein